MVDSSQCIVFKVQGQMVMGRRCFEAPLRFQDSLVNEARVAHVVRGHSTLSCAGQKLELSAGDTVLMKSDKFVNQWHQQPKESGVELMAFRLTSELLQRLYPSGIPRSLTGQDQPDLMVNTVVKLSGSKLISGYMASMKGYIDQPDVLSESMLCLKLREFVELLMIEGNTEQMGNLLSQVAVNKQPKLQEVVQQHLYTPLNIDDLAFLCHMSESTFTRKFKQLYGTTVNKYLTLKRLEKARELVAVSQHSLTEIALECGFEELNYFSRKFKQHFQMSPSQLRKQQ